MAEPLTALTDEALLARAERELARSAGRWPLAAGLGLGLAAAGAWLGRGRAAPTSGWAFFAFLVLGVVPATALVDGLYRLAARPGSRPGCAALAAVAAALDVGAAVALGQAGPGAFGAGLGALAGGVLGGAALATWLLDRPSPAVALELRRRFRAPADALAAARRALADEDGPDRVLLLEARALPHGGARWVRVDLWLGARPRGRVEARRSPFSASREGLAGHARAAAPLPESDAAELAGLTSLPELPSIEALVRDGLPCELRLLRRDQPELRASLNLAGLAELQRREPTARLAQAALEVAGRLASRDPG